MGAATMKCERCGKSGEIGINLRVHMVNGKGIVACVDRKRCQRP